MDCRITKDRFKNMLAYDWLKIILSIVAVCLIWSLLFTMTATRITTGQDFYLVVYDGVINNSANSSQDILDKIKKSDLSYDVLNDTVMSVTSAGSYSASYMLNLRLTTYEGDVMLIPSGRNGETAADSSESVSESASESDSDDDATDIESLINNGYMYSFTELLSDAKDYCTRNGFVTVNDDGTYNFNESAMENYFRNVRIKRNSSYKKMYRNEAKIAEDVPNEISRIKAVWENTLFVENAVKEAKEADNDFLYYFTPYSVDNDNNKTYKQNDSYGIDLGKLNKGADSDIMKVWYVSDGGDSYTAEGLLLTVFDFTSKQPDLQYETISFLRYIIENYSVYGK